MGGADCGLVDAGSALGSRRRAGAGGVGSPPAFGADDRLARSTAMAVSRKPARRPPTLVDGLIGARVSQRQRIRRWRSGRFARRWDASRVPRSRRSRTTRTHQHARRPAKPARGAGSSGRAAPPAGVDPAGCVTLSGLGRDMHTQDLCASGPSPVATSAGFARSVARSFPSTRTRSRRSNEACSMSRQSSPTSWEDVQRCAPVRVVLAPSGWNAERAAREARLPQLQARVVVVDANAHYPRAPHRGGDGCYEVAVIVIPPRAFCLSVTRTLSGGRSSTSATSFRILTARASQKCPSFR